MDLEHLRHTVRGYLMEFMTQKDLNQVEDYADDLSEMLG